MEGQDLHPLGPAHLQRRARRLDDRQRRRGGNREAGSPASGTTSRASPPAATARRCATCRPGFATSPSATPTTWRRCSRTRSRRPGPTPCTSSSPTPATAARTSTSPACALAANAPNKDNAVKSHGIPRLARGAEALRGSQRRISGRDGRSGVRRSCRAGASCKPIPCRSPRSPSCARRHPSSSTVCNSIRGPVSDVADRKLPQRPPVSRLRDSGGCHALRARAPRRPRLPLLARRLPDERHRLLGGRLAPVLARRRPAARPSR